MDGTLSKETNDVCNEIKSVEKWQNDHVGRFVEDQVFTGFIENLTDQTGIISFFIGTKLTKAQFSMNSVVVDNLQLTRQVSLLTFLRLGMRVTFSVKYSNYKEDLNLKAVIVEVEEPLTYESLSVEEIKYVHNKVFYGKIQKMCGSSGTIVFELNGRTETAVFYKDCVDVSDRKMKGKKTALVVGMPVCLMVVCYSGVNGCSFMATVVRTELETELNIHSSFEEILLHHCVFYGTIKTLTKNSGTASFWGNNMEKEVVFSKNCVLVNKLKLVKNLSLLKVLEVGMPVAFMVDCYRTNSCSFVARSIEVLQEVNLTESHTGVMATILTLTALAGTLTFLEDGREKVAMFFRRSVVINGEKINKSASLLTVLKVGWSVLIDMVPFKGKNYDFIATSVEIQELEDDISMCTPVADDFENVPVEDFGGSIKKITDGAGIVEFRIDNREEKAVFFKKNVLINGKKLSNHDSLLTLFYISMPVSMKITHRTKQGFNFEAVSIDFSHKDILCDIQSANINRNNIRHCGSIERLTKSVGIITFSVNGVEERAIMFTKNLIVNDVRITKGTSLLSLLHVGMSVTFRAIDYIDTYCNCTFRVTHLEMKSWKNSSQDRNLNGIIESLTEFSGSISFQMNSEQRKAIFSKENVYLEGKKIESEVSLLSLFEEGMPVSFKITNFNVSDENLFEVDSIIVEAKPLVRTQQDSGVYHGVIHHLTDTSGKILFQINGIKERAVFFKNSVRICDMKVNPGVSLLTLLKVGMQVFLMVEKCKENIRQHFKATMVEVQNITESPSRSIIGNFFDDQLFHGIVQKIKKSCGVIQFSFNGEMENAIFFPGSVLKIDSQGKNVSLSSVFHVGMEVLLRVKFFVGLCNCNFVAIAVDKPCQDINTNYIQGNIIAVDTESGVVTFQKGNKQRKAIFYRNTLCVNGHSIESGISLSTVLRVGMCVAMKVKKCKDKGFYFEVSEVLHGIQNVFKVSESRHITCCLGTVTEIVSSTTAQLQFELDGQHFGLFNLSDFFVDGQRQDNSQEISKYVKKGDVFFFDATKRNNNDCYLITCVWQGKKPGLLTLLEPYRVLIEDCKKAPCLVTVNVIALFPPHAAVTESNFHGAVLLFISSLRCEDQQLTEVDWIQDYLSVGDKLTLEVGKKDKVFGFPLAKCAWKNRSKCLLSQEFKPFCTVGNQPSSMRIDTQDLCTSSPTHNKEPTSSVHKDACSPCSSTSLTPKYEIAKQVVCGIISSVAFYTGTVEIEVDNKKEFVVFTKKELINKENLTDDFSLSSVLEVGMPVSVTLKSCSETEVFPFKVALVQVAQPLPNINKIALQNEK